MTTKERLFEHYTESKLHFPSDRIVGIFLQGSQNYGLELPTSDVDSKLIVVPTFKDIALNRKPVSTTHVRANDEHIDFKDIRLYIETFRKQNPNFLEILFTGYKIHQLAGHCPRITAWMRRKKGQNGNDAKVRLYQDNLYIWKGKKKRLVTIIPLTEENKEELRNAECQMNA